MTKIMITGGNGFLGKSLQRFLYSRTYEVIAPSSKDLDVLCESAWEKYRDSGINHLLHLAGKIYVPESWKRPVDFFEVNAGGTLRALEFCRKQGIGMTYVSAYIYGIPEHLPVEETDSAEPSNPYACSKYLGDMLCKYYSDLFGVDVTILRLFNVYGPAQNCEMLIPTIICQIKGNNVEIVLNDIHPKRDYVYIDDVCAAIEMSVERTKGFQVFNIGSGLSYSVKAVVDKLQTICKTNKKIISRECRRKNELNDVVAGIRNIQNAWGWIPSVTLDDGLRKCVEWYDENNNTN